MEDMDVREMIGELSPDEAAMVGAFSEDALSEEEALAAGQDDFLPAGSILGRAAK